MSEVLDRNLELLNKHHPYLYHKLMKYINGQYRRKYPSIERILLARQDEMVINMLITTGQEEYLLCNHENPIQEAFTWVDKYIDPSCKTEIVFGMGFGFHIDVLVSSFSKKKVIVFEPDIELFYQIMQVRNLSNILTKCELYVDEPLESIINRLNTLFWDYKTGGIELEPFDVYGRMFENLWLELREKFIKNTQSFSVDVATRKHFGELWTHNYIKNAEQLMNVSNADGLVKNFAGIPAILVSAGPSLSKNVHLLKGLEDRFVIMAAGTAVKILEEYGITPHFMAGIDANETEAEIHRNIKDQNIYFIYSNQVATGSVTEYKGPKFHMNYSADIYTAEFFDFAGIKSEMFLSGPTISNTCFDILHKMGCNPIILIGQDLSYTSGRFHAGSSAEEIGVNDETAEKEGYIRDKDIYGNEVLTRRSFLAMRNWFEGRFESLNGSIEIINATEGGLNIQHARNERLQEVIITVESKQQNISGRIHDIFLNSRFPHNIGEMLEDYKDAISCEIKKLEESSKNQLKWVDLIKRGVYHPQKDKKSFDRAVSKVSELSDQVMQSPIYNSILKNLIEVEFFLISKRLDVATSELSNFEEVKEVYVNAAIDQNKVLMERLNKVKKYLKY